MRLTKHANKLISILLQKVVDSKLDVVLNARLQFKKKKKKQKYINSFLTKKGQLTAGFFFDPAVQEWCFPFNDNGGTIKPYWTIESDA